jgi:glycosyltransferase involved in cell wall biosynthesis
LPELTSQTDRINVLHFLWNGETGGAERAVYQLVRGQLASARVEPAIAFAQGRGPYWQAATELGCAVIDLEVPRGNSFTCLPRMARMMRPYDLHHFHSAEPVLMSASLACRGARRVYTRRGGVTDFSLRRRLRYRATGWILRTGFHAFSGNTAHGAECASRLFGIDRDRFRVTYNGLDFALLEPRRPKDQVRDELGVDSEEFIIGTAANLKRWKRIDRLLRLMARFDSDNVRLLILGDGPDRGRLERVAGELGLGKRAIFAGVQRHIGDYLQVIDTFCLPSAGPESFGNAAVEAMGVGIPTVVFEDGGGLVEHIEPGRTGFVVADERELGSVMRRLIADEALRERIGSMAREKIHAKYTLPKATEQFEALYAVALQDAHREPLRAWSDRHA